MWGHLDENQQRVLMNFVAGEVVHDLGCGDLSLAHRLVELGAKKVIGVDKEKPRASVNRKEVTFKQCYFSEFSDEMKVAFVSWPVNREGTGIEALLQRTPTVIYLGHNFGGTACGSKSMFQHLSKRNVLAQMANRFNTLIVYGSELVTREPIPEEQAALSMSMLPMPGPLL